MGANITDLPLGEMLFDRFDLDEIGPRNGHDRLAEEAGDEQLRVAVVEEDGPFYVSSYYRLLSSPRR